MADIALTCPFCGVELKQAKNGAAHPYKAYDKTACYMNGTFIGSTRFDSWNMRATEGPTVKMAIVDGHPRFSENEGAPVSLSMVNDTVAYYRRQAQGEST